MAWEKGYPKEARQADSFVAALAEISRLTEIVAARRAHQSRIIEAAHKLYLRFGKSDADVMDVWSLAVIDPEPLTAEDITRAHELIAQGIVASPPAPEEEKP